MVLEDLGKERLLVCPNVRESPLYKRTSRNTVQCGVCERRCTVPIGQIGFCKT